MNFNAPSFQFCLIPFSKILHQHVSQRVELVSIFRKVMAGVTELKS